MDLEASEPRCRCCCRCRGRPDNDKKTTTTTATKKTSTTATNRLLVSKCADVFALPLYLACLFYLACWLSPAGIHLPPADFRLLASCSLWLACLFSLACWLSPAGIHLPPADFRLLASCSRLLAVACWLPPLACPLSHDGCCLLASIFACWLFCFYLQLLLGTGGLDSAPDGDYLLAHAEGADPLGILAPLPQKAESTVQRLRHP